MNQLFARISSCIGQQFVQHFKFIISSILASASIEAAQILLPDQPTSSNIKRECIHCSFTRDWGY